jgi:copper chaperone
MLKKYTVEGMTCNHCVHHVTVALNEVEGVKDVKVSLAEKSVLVNAEDSVSFETLQAAVEEAGYKLV